MFPIQDTIPSRHPPIAVVLLILINSLAFLYELKLSHAELEHFFYLFGIVPARFTHPEWAAWIGFPVDSIRPFITSMFLHGGWVHIIGNMWTLWIFGDNVEDRMGPVRFVIFYILCGLTAGIVHWLLNAHSTLPTVGASGAIAGVMGAYFLMYPLARIVVMVPLLFIPFFFEVPAFFFLGFWALTQLSGGTSALGGPQQVGGIAWWAHVGGFVAGMVLSRLFIVDRRSLHERIPRDLYGIEGAWQREGDWRRFR